MVGTLFLKPRSSNPPLRSYSFIPFTLVVPSSLLLLISVRERTPKQIDLGRLPDTLVVILNIRAPVPPPTKRESTPNGSRT